MVLQNSFKLSQDSSHPTARISLSSPSNNPSASHHLIFFVTGNPGLIGYYHTFLNTLQTLLSSTQTRNSPTDSKDQFDIYGQSLAGFEDIEPLPTCALRTYPYSLEEVIESSLESLERLCIQQGPRQGKSYDSIIMIGHSVGAYILLEILQRLKARKFPVEIKAGILLFPTVTHISQSSSGIKINWLFKIPNFPRRASAVAKALISCIPFVGLKWVVGKFTGMPDESASVTTNFLKSRMGIWQALHLAKDEMDTIREDQWNEEVWGVENKGTASIAPPPKLVFYFGDKDHWVADHTRDALIATRGGPDGESSSSAIMLIDDYKVPHGFCINHSEIIAEKVGLWIETILSSS